ncbi:MAG: hypothetical protein HY303_10510 [Candidatus Wallbacteria bacterium]|nr:hypothetical protein [Candidatus Wallbacteria bacterium]
MRRLAMALGLAMLLAPPCDGGTGLLGKVRPRYYAGRIDLHVGPKKVLARSEFMAPYSADTLQFLKTRGVLDGYQGPALEDDEALDRRSIAFLVGKFVQLVEARYGRIFPDELDYLTHPVIEPAMWGHLQVELALGSGLVRPYDIGDWWNKPVSRFELAAIVDRALDGLGSKLRIFRYYDGQPSAHYLDLHSLPTLAYHKLARSLKTGIVEGASADTFRGKQAIRGHEMARTLRRLIVIALSYDPLGV